MVPTTDKGRGLGRDVFELVSSMTPMVNVDLLVRDPDGRVLLSWRDDPHDGRGWHIPGRVIRFHETISDSLKELVTEEFKMDVVVHDEIVCISELIRHTCNIRGHFISMLYRGTASSEAELQNGDIPLGTPGFLKWHDGTPKDLLSWHKQYIPYINGDK